MWELSLISKDNEMLKIEEIMDFKGTGDYDKAIYFVEFEIK